MLAFQVDRAVYRKENQINLDQMGNQEDGWNKNSSSFASNTYNNFGNFYNKGSSGSSSCGSESSGYSSWSSTNSFGK